VHDLQELEDLKRQRGEILGIEERNRREREELLKEKVAQSERDAKHQHLIEQLRTERQGQVRVTSEGMLQILASLGNC